MIFSGKPELGLIGYGRFGRLAAQHLRRSFRIAAADTRTIRSRGRGVHSATLAEAASCRIIVLAVPVNKLRGVLRKIAPRLRDGALVLDVCAVKSAPMQWMAQLLPRHVEYVGTHPLFGPDSAAASLRGHTIVLCPGRIRPKALRTLVRHLRARGMRVVLSSPARHDRFIAETLFLPQFIGRSLGYLKGRPEEFQTPSSEKLLHLVRSANNDTEELLRDLFHYSPPARIALQKFKKTSARLRKHLI